MDGRQIRVMHKWPGLLPERGETCKLVYNMADVSDVWHTTLSVLPFISDDTLDKFVWKQSIAKETSIRGYKFFLENYIHKFEGTLLRWAIIH